VNRKFLIPGIVVILIILAWAVLSLFRGCNATETAAKPDSVSAKQLYQQARALNDRGEYLKAKKYYQEILVNHPNTDNIATIQEELENLNMNIIFSRKEIPNKTVVHEVVAGDTLGKIAKKYNTTVEFIQKGNNLKSDMIRIGQKLRVWTGTFNILIDKSQNILILKDGNEVVKVYDVSTGENNCTPGGEYTITTKLVDPVWFNRGAIVPPESPQNVLGSRWLGFDLPGYGIHGTIEPDTIGRQATAGCVRMRNEDVEELYSLVPKDTKVMIVD